MITDIQIHGIDVSLGLNNTLDLIHSIDTLQSFITEAVVPGNVIIGNVYENCTKTLSELLAKVPTDDDKTETNPDNEPATQSADTTESNENTRIDGKLSVDTDIFFKIDENISESEVFERWNLLCTEAIGLVGVYQDYCPTAYEAAGITFMSQSQLKYITYYKMLLEVWLKMRSIIVSKYNTANGFKHDIMARDILMKASNEFAITIQIINSELSDSYQIDRVYDADVEHWMKEELPRIIGYNYASESRYIKHGFIYKDTLLEASQLACKLKALTLKLDQMHFNKMKGCTAMLEEIDSECLKMYEAISLQGF